MKWFEQGASLIFALGSVSFLSAQTTQIYNYSVPSSGGYAPNSNIINYSDQITGSWNMQYDSLNRLQNAASASGYYNGLTLQWQYDSFGNRLSQTPSGTYGPAVPGAISATYDQNNRIATSSVPGMGPSSYDAAGNVIFDGNNYVAYDAEGRVCAVLNGSATLTQYLYNAEGQRVAKGHSASGSTLACPVYGDFMADEKYILGQGGEQVTQLNGSDQWQHSNVWANGQLLATYDPQGLHFNITDPLGTKRVQTSANGTVERNCVSLPFGDGLSCFGDTDATQHHFTGKERDTESGLDYFGARHYNSTMGRFMSPDPGWSLQADPAYPQTWNMYSYGLNNPLINIDPTGKTCQTNSSDGTVYDDNDGKGCTTVDEADKKAPPAMTVYANGERNMAQEVADSRQNQYVVGWLQWQAGPPQLPLGTRQFIQQVAADTAGVPTICSAGVSAQAGIGGFGIGGSYDSNSGGKLYGAARPYPSSEGSIPSIMNDDPAPSQGGSPLSANVRFDSNGNATGGVTVRDPVTGLGGGISLNDKGTPSVSLSAQRGIFTVGVSATIGTMGNPKCQTHP